MALLKANFFCTKQTSTVRVLRELLLRVKTRNEGELSRCWPPSAALLPL